MVGSSARTRHTTPSSSRLNHVFFDSTTFFVPAKRGRGRALHGVLFPVDIVWTTLCCSFLQKLISSTLGYLLTRFWYSDGIWYAFAALAASSLLLWAYCLYETMASGVVLRFAGTWLTVACRTGSWSSGPWSPCCCGPPRPSRRPRHRHSRLRSIRPNRLSLPRELPAEGRL